MDDRRYPRFPIPGVGAIVVGRKGILLARRDKPPGTGRWSIPGGGVEVGETQEESIVREVREETGVECEVIKFITTADLITRDESGSVEFHFLLNHYLARALTEDTRPEFQDGEVAWFHPDNLPPDMVNEELVSLLESISEQVIEIIDS